jgi:hypothetical protein
MPQNPFPESIEKHALRCRDSIYLEAFREQYGLAALQYCGLTSAEFRDIQVWRQNLRSVHAVELQASVRNDMSINWRRLKLAMPLEIVQGDILDYLREASTPCFDVYNLDFYGGFTYPKKDGSSRCREAIRSLASRHREQKKSFALISTFNIRDAGAEQYDGLIGELKPLLTGCNSVDSNLRAHGRSHAAKIKLSYTYTCWHAGVANDFDVDFKEAFVYTSNLSTLVHFYSEFSYLAKPLPTPFADRATLVKLANLPLKRMDGRIPRIELKPDAITIT